MPLRAVPTSESATVFASRSLYATAGTDAAQAAEDSKGFLDGMARLAGLCDLLAKTVALSLVGTARSGDRKSVV